MTKFPNGHNMPVVSIIVPVYNVDSYLRRCIDSILAQTFTDFECILVDDSSPDRCPAICDEYAQKDNRIKVIHKAQNEGLPLARKTGFENSSGEYIQHIDSDDYVEPDMIENLYAFATSGNFDMVCCDWYKQKESGDVLYKNMPPLSNDYIYNIRYLVFAFGMQGAVWNKLVNRKVYERIEFPIYSYTEDRYIVAQLLFFSKNIGYINKAFYHYVYNSNSLVHSLQKKWDRYNGAYNNFRKTIDFLNKNQGENLGVFEPELSIRERHIKKMYPRSPRNILKKILRVMVPVKAWRIWLRKMFFSFGKLFIWNL